jgi:hypothetical protein
MLLLVPATLAMVAALLCGGSLRYLATLQLRGKAFILSSFAVQAAFYLSPLRHLPLMAQWGSVIYAFAIGLALIGALHNRHLGLAVQIAALGVAFNAAVILANGGHMPVNAAALRVVEGPRKVGEVANRHLYNNTRPADASARLVFLSDIIPVVVPGGPGNVYSVGDMLLSAGLSVLVFRTVRPPRKHSPQTGAPVTTARQEPATDVA